MSDYSEDDAADDDIAYGLVMPFVVCQSQGGAYDDAAFVAGVAFGAHQWQLTSCPDAQVWAAYVLAEMVPQYDLLAMDRGFIMASEPWEEHPDEWVLVTFTKPTAIEAPDA